MSVEIVAPRIYAYFVPFTGEGWTSPAVITPETGRQWVRWAKQKGVDGVKLFGGDPEIVRMVKYAYERGVRYIDTADNYKTHEMVREAIKANKLSRESLFIQSKLPIKPEVMEKWLWRNAATLLELGI